eukprot:scaffold15_cov204-Amphora_coffeaeformis.AAC.16
MSCNRMQGMEEPEDKRQYRNERGEGESEREESQWPCNSLKMQQVVPRRRMYMHVTITDFAKQNTYRSLF